MPTAVVVALAWLPLLLLWVLFVLVNADATVPMALRSGGIAIGTAALMGHAVWWATGKLPWPDRVRPGFYAVHALLGGLYAVIWLVSGEIIGHALGSGIPGWEILAFWRWENWPWRTIMGLWLYGLVAGVSYTLRIRERLREQERAAARLEALATAARLRSLRARLNPHFLFNALNSVAALIEDDPAIAEASVERLADLLRYSLDEGDGPVPLADEWDFTRAYVEMERLRLGDRLVLETAIDERALARSVPPFSVQTLVENAVRHAVAPRTEVTRVRVEAGLEGDAVVVEVTDDGPGDAGSAGEGSGLRNLRERLDGMYGDRASLELETAPGEGFRARLRIPREAARP